MLKKKVKYFYCMRDPRMIFWMRLGKISKTNLGTKQFVFDLRSYIVKSIHFRHQSQKKTHWLNGTKPCIYRFCSIACFQLRRSYFGNSSRLNITWIREVLTSSILLLFNYFRRLVIISSSLYIKHGQKNPRNRSSYAG